MSKRPFERSVRQLRFRETRHLLLTTLPGAFWIVLFLVLPSLYLVSMAFLTNGTYGQPSLPLTFDAFRQLAGFGFLGWSPGNLYTLLRSLWQTVVATALVVVIAYPIAYYITLCRQSLRPIMLLLVVVPSWTNQVIRAFGWMNLLAPDTPLSNLAQSLGLIAPHMGLFPSSFAVTLGLIYNFLPFMVLPLYAAFEKLDTTLVEAARDLYASPLKAFWVAVFPQTLPGLLAGIVLVAVPAFGMYVVPELLGGGRSLMIGNLVASQFAGGSNWPYGAAASLLMLVATLLGIFLLRRLGRRAGGGEEVVI
ncbi:MULTISPECIES: ABC transporter permease [Larsenimonas]|uniref:ABC transporter permease n=1 Tax=Larsenimonas suaedae TaxID=1851019 RepID=A0ABU1GVV5_9GAMM|nr:MULTISPECIES: ABC transporter permease [Larsenimonas]MCM2970977.1 ABC transporter permease [Larsenimonas suaedae]MCM5703083.1 ABC transporter permease [Larsenimonas salina]MDR5895686.1 ABC transporter permease [Larsenimonas suaedae]